jgi:glutaredoxin-related protein
VSAESLETKLNDLLKALDAFDSAEIKKSVDALQEFTALPDSGAIIEKILKNVFIGEYDEATALINSLLKSTTPP